MVLISGARAAGESNSAAATACNSEARALALFSANAPTLTVGGAGLGGSGAKAFAAGGFDSGRGAERGAPAPQAVQAADFDTQAAQPAAVQATRPPVEVPLEILSKPTPAYTDEARTLNVEGEVLLEVEFSTTGEIRVLRVVRGLGHGLDESAARAVQGMRFKPAQRNGQPVDIRTTVNIVFRLA